MKQLRVKFLGNYRADAWIRQFPQGHPDWENCVFTFDPEDDRYDWLIVYNDMPGYRLEESLACAPQNTLLITTEPSTIKSYGPSYLRQFGHVLTSQEPWAIRHPGKIYSQPALQWYYGLGAKRMKTYDEMVSNPPVDKTRSIATVCSNKQQNHTLHNRRYAFTQALKAAMADLDIFGHGVIEIDDKAQALDTYCYHVAIENFVGEHHWTEKLSDVFLGHALPFYCGCPNVFDYFPEESLIPIDIFNTEQSIEVIQKAIRDGEYEKRIPAIQEARRLVLEKYNLFAVLSTLIKERHQEGARGGQILARRTLRKKSLQILLADVVEKWRIFGRHALVRMKG